MSRPLILVVALGCFLVNAWQQPSFAQDESSPTPRVLAPGVLTVVEPEVLPKETFTNFRSIDGLEATPFTPNEAPVTDTLHSRLQKVIFRHDAWCYEFAYKPLRMIRLDIPQPSGKMQRKVVWYLVYRVRNLGQTAALGNEQVNEQATVDQFDIQPQAEPDPTTLPGRFFPSFVMEGWASTDLGAAYDRKAYLDRVIPTAVPQIQAEEDPAIKLYDSVRISTVELPVANSESSEGGVWGVATWEDIDPRLDYVSVFVQGLSNAYEMRDLADGTREFQHKTLQLNFWRPGDTLDETRDEIFKGIPLVDSVKRQVQITQRYGLPGPVIQVSRFDAVTDRNEDLFEVDGMVNEELESRLLIQLQAGEMPQVIIDRLETLGVEVPVSIGFEETIRDRQWEFSVDVDGEPQNFRLRLENRFWELVGQELQYLRGLEHRWLYR